MSDLSQEHGMMHHAGGRLLLPRQCHAGRLRPGIKFEHVGMYHALLDAPVFEANGIRLDAVNHRSSALAQKPRPFFGARIEWTMVLVKDKHTHVSLFPFGSPYGPSDTSSPTLLDVPLSFLASRVGFQ